MPASNPADFFLSKRNIAEIKAEIGLAVFGLWCDLHLRDKEENTVMLLDLNSGSGLDTDGNALLPLRILENISQSTTTDLNLTERVQVIFADNQKSVLAKFWENLEPLDFYANLARPAIILDEAGQTEFLAGWSAYTAPALMLVDPFSYSWAQEMFARTVSLGNSDLLLVFDFAKLQKAVPLDQPDSAWPYFWGKHWQDLHDFYSTTGSAVKKEKFIIEQLSLVLQDQDYYPLPFKINVPDKKRTSLYVFFASRNKAAYLKIKELLLVYSDLQPDGVPLFGANLRDEAPAIPGFFRFSHPFCLENLAEELSQKKKDYHFQSIREIYEAHSPGTNYVLHNYITAFTSLRDLGHINILNSANKQVKTVTADGVVFYKLHRAGTR